MISLRASVEPSSSIRRSFSPLSTVKSVHCRATAEKSIDPQARRYICRRNIDDASGLVWSSVRPPPPTPESPTQLPALSWLRRMLTACTDELVEVSRTWTIVVRRSCRCLLITRHAGPVPHIHTQRASRRDHHEIDTATTSRDRPLVIAQNTLTTVVQLKNVTRKPHCVRKK